MYRLPLILNRRKIWIRFQLEPVVHVVSHRLWQAHERPYCFEPIMAPEKKSWQLYLLISLPVLHVLLFSYGPMYGIQIAFKDFFANQGIIGSNWVGLKHFNRFFNSYYFGRILKNTLTISLAGLVAGFPVPVALALMLNEVSGRRIRKTIQTATYAPYFISVIVLVGLLQQFLDARIGPLNNMLGLFGLERIYFMGEPGLFVAIFVISEIWQGAGYAAVIYLAALSVIDPDLYEAAVIDGASRLQKIWHIDLPGIAPTVTILLIMSLGSTMNVGFEKIYLMQNPLNESVSEVISTYVYKIGLVQIQYSFASAVGLFNSVINCILLVLANGMSRKFGGASFW